MANEERLTLLHVGLALVLFVGSGCYNEEDAHVHYTGNRQEEFALPANSTREGQIEGQVLPVSKEVAERTIAQILLKWNSDPKNKANVRAGIRYSSEMTEYSNGYLFRLLASGAQVKRCYFVFKNDGGIMTFLEG